MVIAFIVTVKRRFINDSKTIVHGLASMLTQKQYQTSFVVLVLDAENRS